MAFARPRVEIDETPRPSRPAGYERTDLSFASVGDNGQPDQRVTGTYYRALHGRPRGVVIVLPIWGRSTYPANKVARGLREKQQLDIVSIDGEAPLFDWTAIGASTTEEEFVAAISGAANAYRATVDDLRLLIDWIAERPDVDRKRIGVVGFSISAILAATLVGIETRIDRAALVMGGGDIAAIMASCPGRGGRVRRRLLERLGWTNERYRAVIARELASIDPMRFAHRADPEKLLYIDAANDAFIPDASRQLLWEGFGRPARVTIQNGHRISFLALTLLDGHRETRRLSRFFHRDRATRPAGTVASSPS